MKSGTLIFSSKLIVSELKQKLLSLKFLNPSSPFYGELGLSKSPIRSIQGTILFGAVAGIRIDAGVDKYAYRQGLFVLKQKGKIVEISNDEKFIPQQWKVGE